ncbi:MSHA pilin protein MshA [Desulfobaculum xiamenense]|uniref:MSHA pilin protein MshA n=1 Tax=Desulfobaculum xiamenense TaxID=995050 RepID=A0A846QK35_9BACT|nr:type II secretion system protein [Desulfobaculum xiamenense]NJB68568.1 MSHA pilin protein MshA [Desulfobaculum xiamenense]
MKQNNRKKNGFTMIELIAVIVILGILAAAAVPRFLDARADAREAAADGIIAAWQSECSLRVANAALNDATTIVCPTGAAADTSWTHEVANSGLSIVGAVGTGTGGTGQCTFQVTGTGLTRSVTYTLPTGFTGS